MDKTEIIISLEREREEYQARVQTLSETIDNLKKVFFDDASGSSNGINVRQKFKEYFFAKSKRQKVISVLKIENKFLHKREIVEIIRSLEPKSVTNDDVESIAGAVYALKNADLIISKSVDNSNINTFWGSKQWVDKDGNIKPEHMYNEDQLSSNRSEKFEI